MIRIFAATGRRFFSGLSLATLLTLFVIPYFSTLFHLSISEKDSNGKDLAERMLRLTNRKNRLLR